ncbi:MAG: hypothetical protein KBS70_07070 [Bacteroidales bacterium]|nr:hypothetical protein [Candidatus Colicola equi]
MKIIIKGQEVDLKYTYRARLAYERVAGEAFKWKDETSLAVFIYCCIVSRNITITWEEYLDILDNDMNLLGECAKWLKDAMTVAHRLSDDGSTSEGKAEEENGTEKK